MAGGEEEEEGGVDDEFTARGERLFEHLDGGLDGEAAGYTCVELVSSPGVAHVVLARTPPA